MVVPPGELELESMDVFRSSSLMGSDEVVAIAFNPGRVSLTGRDARATDFAFAIWFSKALYDLAREKAKPGFVLQWKLS